MEMNYLAVVVAAISSFLLGGIWYSPLMFLKPWAAAMGRSEEDEDGHPAKVFGISFVFALVSAAAFAYWLGPAPQIKAALQSALIVGICFVTMSFGINYQFANRPINALLIDGGYHTGQFLLYATVLSFWPFN